jgi:small subunit ribosomal protein S2
MPEIPTLLELLKAGVHFGHRVSKLHPKMKPYVFTQKNGVHIINVEITQEKLKEALKFVKRIVSNGGTILFLGTKKQANSIIKKYATECKMPYITGRWLGGTFTNFSEISKVINRMIELKEKKKSGELEKYTKKEQLKFDREIEKLEQMVGGIENLKKLPEAIYIIDLKREKTAVAEAYKKEIPIIGICDTNVNPDKVNYIIPANDDATKSIELITRLVSEAVKEGLVDKETKKKEA